MSARGKRIAFGVFVFVLGSIVVAPLFFADLPSDFLFLGALCEIALLVVSAGIALTAPPPFVPKASTNDDDEPPVAPVLAAVPSSVYRGALPPPVHPLLAPITRASAKRITAGILAALAFTAAAVPFALRLPRWIEFEVVVAIWWAMWSVVLGVVAYEGARVEDDRERTASGPAVDFTTKDSSMKPKWSWVLDALSAGDPEGCLIAIVVLAVVGVALLGAWFVVELAAPAVFVLAYRGVVKALAKAQAANSRGNAPRSALVGMGWAAVHTAPLAGVAALVHALFT